LRWVYKHGVPIDVYIDSIKGNHNEEIIKLEIAIKILKKLEKISGKDISHGDLTQGNILYDASNQSIHLIDYGNSVDLSTKKSFANLYKEQDIISVQNLLVRILMIASNDEIKPLKTINDLIDFFKEKHTNATKKADESLHPTTFRRL